MQEYGCHVEIVEKMQYITKNFLAKPCKNEIFLIGNKKKIAAPKST
jgi:hypothetical protein